MPDISHYDTVVVLQSFSQEQRKALLKELGGGYQLSQQKATWAEDASDKSDYCEDIYSKEHRLLYCPIGEQVRSQYTAFLQDLEECGSLIPQYPFATVHLEHKAMQVIMHRAPEPTWGDQISMHVHSMITNMVEVLWFTDGSCFHPASPNTRYSAFAIILDLCESLEQRRHFGSQYAGTSRSPPSLQVATVARTQGEQDILRAEMQAVAAIMLHFGEGVIHTDSQCTIDYMQTALHALVPYEFSHCEHMDILFRVWTN